jgi:hypothetical protein
VDGSVGGRRVVFELEFEREGGLGLLRLVEEGHRDGARFRREADAQRERELSSGDHVVVVLWWEEEGRGVCGSDKGSAFALNSHGVAVGRGEDLIRSCTGTFRLSRGVVEEGELAKAEVEMGKHDSRTRRGKR